MSVGGAGGAAGEAAAEAAVEAAVARATQLFNSGYNCAESVLEALTGFWGLPSARPAAALMGGGMARSGYVCGALSGGLMALGLRLGPLEVAEQSRRRAAINIGGEVIDWFGGRAGTVMCREIIGLDLRATAGLRQLKESGVHQRLCLPLVQDVVRRLAASLPAARPPADGSG